MTARQLIAQDVITLKNGKVISGKIISLSYGIKLLTAKDTIKFSADEVASIVFCNSNTNCPDSNTNSNSGAAAVTYQNTKNNPCNCTTTQNESADKIKPKTAKNGNSKY